MKKIPLDEIILELKLNEIDDEMRKKFRNDLELQVQILNVWLRKNPKLQCLFVSQTHPARSSEQRVHLSFILENMDKTIKFNLKDPPSNRTEYGLKELQSILSTIDIEVFQTVLKKWNQDVVEPRIYVDHDYR